MKKVILLLALILSSNSYSGNGYIKGKVEYIRVHDKTIHSSDWAPPIFWFTLENSGSAGDCGQWRGKTLFVMDTDQAYSMVLGAFMAGKEVTVRFDDEIKNGTSSYCLATLITIGNPPPLD